MVFLRLPVLTLKVLCIKKPLSPSWGHPSYNYLYRVNCLEIFVGSPMSVSLVFSFWVGRFPKECSSNFLHGSQSPAITIFELWLGECSLKILNFQCENIFLNLTSAVPGFPHLLFIEYLSYIRFSWHKPSRAKTTLLVILSHCTSILSDVQG